MFGTTMIPSSDDLKAAYTAAQYAGTNSPPSSIWRVGTVYIDPATGKKYIFLKQVGSTALAAKKAALVSDASAWEVTLAGAALAQRGFAGVRVSGATSLAQNEYGWFQISGNATFIFGDTARATVAGEGVVIDDDTDLGNIGGVNLDVTNSPSESTIEAALVSLHGVFGTAQAAVSTTDADVEVQIERNAWGV